MQFLIVAPLCLLVLFAFDETSSKVNNLDITEAYKIMCCIVVAIAIVRSANQYTSVVTAFWGALAAVAYNDQWLNNYPLTAALLSLIVAPLLGVLFFSVYDRLFDHFIFISYCSSPPARSVSCVVSHRCMAPQIPPLITLQHIPTFGCIEILLFP